MAERGTVSDISEQEFERWSNRIAWGKRCHRKKSRKLGKFEDLDIIGSLVGSPFD
jgi:hypothetical protein